MFHRLQPISSEHFGHIDTWLVSCWGHKGTQWKCLAALSSGEKSETCRNFVPFEMIWPEKNTFTVGDDDDLDDDEMNWHKARLCCIILVEECHKSGVSFKTWQWWHRFPDLFSSLLLFAEAWRMSRGEWWRVPLCGHFFGSRCWWTDHPRWSGGQVFTIRGMKPWMVFGMRIGGPLWTQQQWA